jgi:hypothetical protein
MWEYAVVFALAATPLVELLVVIPGGIAAGLNPVAVAGVALLGNALPVLAIVAAFDRWQAWRAARAEASGVGTPVAPGHAAAPGSGLADDGVGGGEGRSSGQGRSRRRARAQRTWTRYGMPGLALLAPLTTGVHLAAVAALALGSSRWQVTVWLLGSIAVWAASVTLLTVAGVEGVRFLLR